MDKTLWNRIRDAIEATGAAEVRAQQVLEDRAVVGVIDAALRELYNALDAIEKGA